MNYSLGALLSAAFLVAVCSGQTAQADASAIATGSIDYVAKECNQKLMDIDSLARFETFMSHYEAVVSQAAKPKRGIMNLDKGLRKCYDIGEQLRALRQILASRQEGVCRMAFVERLVDFHSKQLVKQEEQHPETVASNKSHYAAHIFSLIAHQVAYTCKSNLGARLEQLQASHNCDQVMGSFLPADALDGYANASQSREANSMSDFMSHFQRVEDLSLITARPSGSSEPYFDVIVSPAVLDRISQLKGLCSQRERHYMRIFAPIVSLSQIGYEVPDELISNDQAASIEPGTLKCWLATAQLCQGILRVHVSAKQTDGESQDDHEEAVDRKKLIEIKFGPAPSDVQIESAQSAGQLDDEPVITFHELSPVVIDLAKKRGLLRRKIKRKVANWARKFVENHLDIEGLRNEGARKFMEALTRDDELGDAPVAFAGKKRNQGLYLAPRMVADDADTIVQSAGFFVPKGIAIFFSSVTAICLSAVFVWFSLYALVSTMVSNRLPGSSGNFKESWRKLRDDRMKTIDDKVKRRGWKDGMMIYSSPTG